MDSVEKEVEHFTDMAHALLQHREDEKAIKLFRVALNRAKSSTEVVHQQACINLGAALIAVRRPREALKIMSPLAISPPDNNAIAGDLFYNVALLHEQLGNRLEARKHFHKSVEQYSLESNCILLKAGVSCKLAAASIQLSEYQAAADAYGEAAMLYGSAGLTEQQARCLYQKTLALDSHGSVAQAEDTANECELTCQNTELTPSLGKKFVFTNNLNLMNVLSIFFLFIVSSEMDSPYTIVFVFLVSKK